MRRNTGVTLASVLAVAATGCEAPPGHARNINVTGDTSACDAVRACDVGEQACQQAVLQLTACVRGQDAAPLPSIRKISLDQLRSELHASSEAMGIMPTPIDAALRALHLLPKGVSAVDASIETTTQLWAAYYDPETTRVTMLDDTSQADPLEAMYTLSHEFTHYLQDRQVGLKAIYEHFGSSADSQIATRTLLEGEALVNSTRVLARLKGLAPSGLNWERLFNLLDADLVDQLNASMAPLQASALSIPYPVGGRYVATVWNHYDRQHVDALFDEAPHSVVDWAAGYGNGQVASTLSEELSCAPPLAPDGFSVYGIDHLGTTGALAMLSAAGNPDLKLAAAVRGDTIALYTPSDAPDPNQAPVLAVWRLRFRDTSTANAFASQLAPLHITIARLDREVVLSVSSNEALPPLQGAVLQSCPAQEDLKPLHEPQLPMAAIRGLLP
jgi:hypothetical protein